MNDFVDVEYKNNKEMYVLQESFIALARGENDEA